MRENLVQAPKKRHGQRSQINDDWYPLGIPENVVLAPTVYMDTSYGFAGFCSTQEKALLMDEASGLYDIVSFTVSGQGTISIGKYAIINGATLVCNNNITIGDHCMLAWGATLTDTWLHNTPLQVRRELLYRTSHDPSRPYPFAGQSLPVVLEDNCWVGFGAVILPGVRLGTGCVVGCKTVVATDVPPYAVVAGSPAKIVRYLTPQDGAEERTNAMRNG